MTTVEERMLIEDTLYRYASSIDSANLDQLTDVLQREVTLDATVTTIGDCVTPRRISHAIAEGYRIGATV